MVGPARFELAAFRPPDGRANQTAPRPDAGHIDRSRRTAQGAAGRFPHASQGRPPRIRRKASCKGWASGGSGCSRVRSALAVAASRPSQPPASVSGRAAGVLLLPLVWLGVAALQHPLAFIHALLDLLGIA